MDPAFDRLALLTQSAYARLLDQLLVSSFGDLGTGVTLAARGPSWRAAVAASIRLLEPEVAALLREHGVR
jgi:hypothetical protein